MQRTSTRSDDVEQLDLLPARKASGAPDLAYLATLPDFRRAIRYSLSLADMEPKQVYEPLGKDKATWSRIEHGDMGFPADLIVPFQRVVGNRAAILWLNHASGFDLASIRLRQDDKDRRIFDLERQLEDERQKNRIISEFVRETRKS